MKNKNVNWKSTVALIVGIILIAIPALLIFMAYTQGDYGVNFFSYYLRISGFNFFGFISFGFVSILGIASILFSFIIKAKNRRKTISKCCLIFGCILVVLSFLVSINDYIFFEYGTFLEHYFGNFFSTYSGSYGLILILGIIAIVAGVVIKVCKEEKPVNQVSSVSNKSDDLDALLRFKRLLDQGAITQEEFEAKKKDLLHQTPKS